MQQQLQGIEKGWWLFSFEGRIWLPKGDIPYGEAKQWHLIGTQAYCVGEWQGDFVWLICQPREQDMVSVRQLLDRDRGLFQLIGKAVQLEDFYRSHQFCGYCGHKMVESKHEWACLCHHCRKRYYPQIAPCIIVAIRRDDHILLAQHKNHRNGIYTALAGFVEMGETLEQAVVREVYEESRITIRNLRYIASQPWPFPHSLMMGYMADYDNGEIQIESAELNDANWFHYNQLPTQLPPIGTIARRLIEDTIALCREEQDSEY